MPNLDCWSKEADSGIKKGGELVKRCLIFSMTFFLSLLPVAGSAADGETLFIGKCGSCHKRGGQAAPVNPADKAGRVWEKYFKRGRHPVDLGMSDSDLQLVVKYLVDHAADSDQPAAAVIPK